MNNDVDSSQPAPHTSVHEAHLQDNAASAGMLGRHAFRQTARGLMAILGAGALAIAVWWLFFSVRLENVYHGEFDPQEGMIIQIPKMPYVYAVDMLFCPTNTVESVRLSSLRVAVYDRAGRLVKQETVGGDYLLGTAWHRNRSTSGKFMVYRLVEDRPAIRLGKAYSVHIDLPLKGECLPQRIEVFSESYW